jgi:hypothetical protein
MRLCVQEFSTRSLNCSVNAENQGDSMASPQLLLSTRSSGIMRLDRYQAVVASGSCHGIDLDATSDLRRLIVSSNAVPKLLANSSISSIWLTPSQLEGRGLQPYRDFARITGTNRLPNLVVDIPADSTADDALSVQIAAARRLRNATGPQARIAVAIRAENREGNHDHIERMTLIRHQVGEWEFGIALDLTIGVDGAWEAEAAVIKLLPRLSMIRLVLPRTMLSGGVRWRIASRTVAAACDSGFTGIFSIAPDLSLWERLSVNALSDRCAMFATNLDRRASLVRSERSRLPGRRTIS